MITALLKSVLTTEELTRFTSKTDLLKEKQLHDISRILVGIKIFNDGGKKIKDANIDRNYRTVIPSIYFYCETSSFNQRGGVSEAECSKILHP